MGSASMMRSATLSVDPDDDPRSTGPAGAGVRFWAALAVAAIAVAGFGGVVAYGYLAYGDRGEHMPAPLVKADTRPAKVRPDDPGGLSVQHTDMEVFNAGRDQRPPGAAPGAPAGREVLLPPPEPVLPKPVPAPAPAPITLTPAIILPAAPLAATPAPAPEPTLSGVASAIPYPAPLPPPAAPTARLLQRSASASPAESGSTSILQAPRPMVGTGAFRIQIGAMRTEEEARQAWESVKRKHADIIGGKTMSISRVELAERGVFFRVYAGPLADRDAARDACAKLVSAGTGCLVVPPS